MENAIENCGENKEIIIDIGNMSTYFYIKMINSIDTSILDNNPHPVSYTHLKPRIGLVGEILVKFHPTANNQIVDIIEAEGGEAVMPDLIDFFQYCFYNTEYEHEHFDAKKTSVWLSLIHIYFKSCSCFSEFL